MDPRQETIKMRAYLELKNGSFLGTLELLQQPEHWKDLTGADRRLIKCYAARIGGGTVKVADGAKTNAVR
jgi:hypothetical protein